MNEILKKYLIKSNKEDILHSTTYGKAQSGSNIGNTSAETFAARLALERNRHIVKGYSHSSLMGKIIVHGSPKPKTYTPPEHKPRFTRQPKNPSN